MEGRAPCQGLTRRDIGKAAVAGAAGFVLASRVLASEEAAGAPAGAAAVPPEAGKPPAPKIPLRDLGKTGLKVSEISLGAMDVTDQAVVERAIDLGCTYIDTSASYQGGMNEQMLGRVMKTRRKEVVLATNLGDVDASLKRLQADYVDVILVHGAAKAADVKHPPFKEAFDKAKKAGKAGFFGFTTHHNQAEVLNACIETGYVDVVMLGYGAGAPQELTDVVKRAHDAGIGIVTMKSVQGAKGMKKAASALTGYQLAVRALLDRPFVDSVNVGMTSFAQLEENLKASQAKLTAADRVMLERFAAACAATQCGRCGACRKCPRGVVPSEILRAHMYAYEYGKVDKALREFDAMGGPAMLAACTACGRCEKNCPRRLNIRQRFAQVAKLMA